MKPARVRLKKLVDTVVYTPNKYSAGVLIFELIDIDDNVRLVKLDGEYTHEISVKSFLSLYENHERYVKTLEKMFHYARDYLPYDPTPVRVKSVWNDSERMHTPKRPLLNMSNLEQRKMFTHLASVPVDKFIDIASNKYGFNHKDMKVFWTIHYLVEEDKLKVSDILRVNRVASLPDSNTSEVLLISITDRKGKVRVFDYKLFSENKISRREMKDYVQFSYKRASELAAVLWTISNR
jgi:hypothetical protein